MVLISSCNKAVNSLTVSEDNDQVGQLLHDWQEAHGGLEHWRSLQIFSFRKTYALYTADGDIESEVEQWHRYDMKEGVDISIRQDINGDKIRLRSDLSSFDKYVNDVKVVSAAALKSSILAGHYVAQLPFNINTEKAIITYEGLDTFNQSAVHVLKCDFNQANHSAGDSEDIWWHYIDLSTNLSQGYMVKHADHHSLITNDTFESVNGFTLISERRSYRCTPSRERLYLRATYMHDKYDVR